METQTIPATVIANPIARQQRHETHFIPFTEQDIEDLALYAFDMNYLVEPEPDNDNQGIITRFKITSKSNLDLFGWVSKVTELVEGEWQEGFIYGFYRQQRYFNKYPITFNINSKQVRGIMKRSAEKNQQQTTYFRTTYGILDLEPQVNPITFIFSWLSSCKFQNV